MTEQVEWRRLYALEGKPGRETVFVRGVARGDYYRADGSGPDVFRVRFWPPFRVQGGDERFVLGEDRARSFLLDLAQRALAAEGEAA